MELHEEDEKLTPRKRLGRSVRRLREGAGLSLRQLSDKVDGYSHSYLGRVELGEQLPSEALVRTLDKFFGTGGTLIELWEMVHESLLFEYYRDVIKEEAKARRIQVFNSSLIPALLRTEDYAREQLRLVFPGQTADELAERVAILMRRKHVFDRDEPPFYWAVMDETALKRPIGGKECMKAQLLQVVGMAEECPRATVQVLPFTQGAHSMHGGSLTMLTLENGKTIALTESFNTGEATEAPDKLLVLNQLFDIAQSMALSEHDSFHLIRRYLKEYEDDDPELDT